MVEYRVSTARLKRAMDHGVQLANLWNDVPSGRLCTPRARVDSNGEGELLATKVCEMPDEIPLLLGEMLYQLRSALDACIYQATVYATKRDPPPDEERLEFPITRNAKEWPRLAKRRLMHLSQHVQDVLKKAQPYHSPTLESGQEDFSVNRSLGILNDLARKDRHRKLHVVGSWPFDMTPSFILPNGVTVASFEAQPPAIIREGTIMAKFHLAGFSSGMEAMVNPRLRTTFGCAEPPVPVNDTDTFERRLREMTESVAGVIDFFERNT